MHYKIGCDTNVLFSALVVGKTAGEVLYGVLAKEQTLVCSEYIRDELLDVLRRKKLSDTSTKELFSLSNVHVLPDDTYASKANFTAARKIVRDEKDIPVLAFAKHALEHDLIDFFVSGDPDLLKPKTRHYAKNRIHSVREILEKTRKP